LTSSTVDRTERENAKPAMRTPENAAAIAASELLLPASPTKWKSGGLRSLRRSTRRSLTSPRCPSSDTTSPRGECAARTGDLTRAAELKDLVARSFSGHATPEMQRHHSTVSGDEQRAGIAKVIDIATGCERRAA
jgi:hypothetical protein